MSNCGDEECMTEKTEAKEFAYFSGLTSGRKYERKRILDALKDLHIEKRQLAHIDSPSGVCGTCRAVAIVEGKNK